MSLTPPPPIPTVPIAGSDGMVTPEWWRWFHQFLTYVNNGQQDAISNLVSTTPAMLGADPPPDPAQMAFLSQWIAPPPTVTFGEITGTVPAGTMLPLPQNDIYQGNASGQPAAVTVTAALTASPGVTGSGKVVLDTNSTVSGLTGTLADITGFGLRDTSAAFDVTLAATSAVALTAGRTLTLSTSNVAHTLEFGSTANTITFPSAASYTVAGLSVAGTWSATQTSMTLSGATLTGATTLPGSGTITSGGALLLGFGSAINVAGASTQNLQLVHSGSIGLFSMANFFAGYPSYNLRFGHSRGTTSLAGALVSGDGLGDIRFVGDDGSTNGAITITAAEFISEVDGAVSTGIVPGRMLWTTMNTGGTLAERMRLGSDGSLLVGRTTNAGAGNLDISGVYKIGGTQIAASNLSNGTTGSGAVVLASTPSIATLTLTGATTIPGSGSINTSGQLLIGNNAFVTGSGTQAGLQVVATAGAGAVIARFSANSTASFYNFGKSRGSVSTAGALVSGDDIGENDYYGDDGSTNGQINIIGGTFKGSVDGAVSAGIVPMRFAWATRNTGGTLAERMRLGSDGSLLLGSTTNAGAGAFKATADITAMSGTAIPAGGTAGAGVKVSSATNFGVFFGSGAPTLSAAQGSLYMRSDGSSTSTRLYVNTNGSTTWTNVTTAA